jgi:hypothetical protein
MTHRDVVRRLAALEAVDKARQQRVYTRVAQQLAPAEWACFVAFVKRDGRYPGTTSTTAEQRVLCRVESLTRADPEMRPGDLLGVPYSWMKEHGYAP